MRLRNDRRAERQEQAIERQIWWASLTPSEQLKALDSRLGVGQGAARQRAAIAKRMAQ